MGLLRRCWTLGDTSGLRRSGGLDLGAHVTPSMVGLRGASDRIRMLMCFFKV